MVTFPMFSFVMLLESKSIWTMHLNTWGFHFGIGWIINRRYNSKMTEPINEKSHLKWFHKSNIQLIQMIIRYGRWVIWQWFIVCFTSNTCHYSSKNYNNEAVQMKTNKHDRKKTSVTSFYFTLFVAALHFSFAFSSLCIAVAYANRWPKFKATTVKWCESFWSSFIMWILWYAFHQKRSDITSVIFSRREEKRDLERGRMKKKTKTCGWQRDQVISFF